jgi:hypothetical protein
MEVYGLSWMFQNTAKEQRKQFQSCCTVKKAFELLGLEWPHLKPVAFGGQRQQDCRLTGLGKLRFGECRS